MVLRLPNLPTTSTISPSFATAPTHATITTTTAANVAVASPSRKRRRAASQATRNIQHEWNDDDDDDDDDDDSVSDDESVNEEPELDEQSLAAQRRQAKHIEKTLIGVVRALEKADDYDFFWDPVDDSDAPGYSQQIKEPVCLADISVRVRRREYAGLSAFRADLMLMCNNATQYNLAGSVPWLMAHRLRLKALQELQLVHDQLPTSFVEQRAPRNPRASPSTVIQLFLPPTNESLAVLQEIASRPLEIEEEEEDDNDDNNNNSDKQNENKRNVKRSDAADTRRNFNNTNDEFAASSHVAPSSTGAAISTSAFNARQTKELYKRCMRTRRGVVSQLVPPTRDGPLAGLVPLYLLAAPPAALYARPASPLHSRVDNSTAALVSQARASSSTAALDLFKALASDQPISAETKQAIAKSTHDTTQKQSKQTVKQQENSEKYEKKKKNFLLN